MHYNRGTIFIVRGIVYTLSGGSTLWYMRNIVVVNNPKHWEFSIPDVEIVSARAYLGSSEYADIRNVRIFNLCKSYRYQSAGYYVSLLAEARGHRAFPSVTTLQDFVSQTIVRGISSEIDDLIQRSLARLQSKEFILSIYFGKNMAKQYERISKELYNLFQSPLLRARFVRNNGKWVLQYITPIPLHEIPESHKTYIIEFAKEYFTKRNFRAKRVHKALYDLAILVNPEETSPPSDKRALQHFVDSAESFNFCTEIITKEDYNRIPEFDVLFIRETTRVNHHTYRFSRRAYTEGLVVIDDPLSIVRCTNKVYLAELLSKAKLPIPKTIIVHKDNRDTIESLLGMPCILKQPDSSFSQGVIKVETQPELDTVLENLFHASDFVIAQEFVPTEFDWRIGVLDRKPLYASKYYMARGHWQVYNWKGRDKYGPYESCSLDAVPEMVVSIALKAANLIGDGFYGVDLKQVGNKIYVIEINDNPSIDNGIEDGILQDALYHTVVESFVNRLKRRTSYVLR